MNNNMNMNNLGINNNQLFLNNFNMMNQIQGMNNNPNLMNMLQIQMMNNMQNNVNNNFNLLDENINITTIQEANKIIKQLIKQNKYLNDKINKLEAKIKNFEQYKNQMDLNCYYNQFDIKAYKLDHIYNNLESKEIIKKKKNLDL